MNRLLIIAVIGLAALSFGLAGALVKTRSDTRVAFGKLTQEIETRTAFGGGRRGGDGDGNRGSRRDSDFSNATSQLGLSPAQETAFLNFLETRRDVRRGLFQGMRGKQETFVQVLKGEPLDSERLRKMRADLQADRQAGNDKVFEAFEAFLGALDTDQRKKMLELSRRNANALLFL